MIYTFTLSEEEAGIVLQSLQELPFKVSAGLINKLIAQGKEQQAAESAPTPPSE